MLIRHCPRRLAMAGLIAILVAPAAAGEIFAPDNDPTQGTCNVIPWGSTEYRYQAVVPSTMMGSAAAFLTELAFAPCNSGTFTATTCEIRMAHFTGTTPSATFQTNLEKDVTVVYSAAAFNYPYTTNQWCNVGLTQGFYYNGADSLVVEVRYLGGAGGTSFHRSSNIVRVYTGGSGSYNATSGSAGSLAALKMRFTTSDVQISGSGSTQPGGAVDLQLLSAVDPGKPYQVGTSLGDGPIPIGSRQLGLSLDTLLVLSTSGLLPGVFVNYAGLLDGSGKATARINIPKAPTLIGVRLHSAFVTLDPGAPFGLAMISNTFTFTIQ